MSKVVIIGGGAAGMVAAITAARNGHKVTVLERQSRVGRKLMATGNGRCNLTNRNAAPAHYHGDPDLFGATLEKFSTEMTLDFFAELGLMTVTEDDRRVYPMSNMAGSVLDVLRFGMEREGVEVLTGQVVTDIRKNGAGFFITTETDKFTADKVILAAGGCAGGKVGGVMDGYKLAMALGHHRTQLYPSLVQLKTDPTYPRALKGVKAECAITIRRGKDTVATGGGEVLFTEYGVSGPAIFDLSRHVATGGDELTCELDFFPDYDGNKLFAWLLARREAMAAHEAGSLLTGSVHSRLGQMVVKSAGFTNQAVSALADKDLRNVLRQMKHFTLPITGVCGFDQAQVTAGGLRTDEFHRDTLESKLVDGFYACGEVLDVDGDCGGYNLQWAWSSGFLTGLLL